ncbi:hypothetical protein Q3A66_12220 [Hymenobacter sp. BT770]|uniref:DUF7710 domain-containing protein n=1 Tax=Hymenobacter sp. BT770 TaxID=2886942 RepID=UPI001D123159|nr:hypothetical protein [Hymenobacter sp. BT770]MCC3153596.1 hypothetical protein [Hymenobacter sp. BT770]MDO3415832.1 hypothetical protein [Hymenobacter sp. BT770]
MEQADADAGVWVFHGSGSRFASGVFTTRDQAEAWIHQHDLTGVLTRYPIDQGVYDWAKEKQLFQPTEPEHTEAAFIQRFTSGSQEHFHYDPDDIG